MLSQTIVVDGIQYVLTRAVAKGANLSPDYIASFCRGGLVHAVRHNGMWYVNEASLQKFLADEAQQQAEWKRRLSEQRKRELQVARQASPAGRDATHSTQVKRRTSQPGTAHPAAIRFTQLKRATRHFIRASREIIVAVALTGILMSALAPALPDAQQRLIASGREKIRDALASLGNIPLARDQLAAASNFPWLEEFAKNFHAALCPILRNCPSAERATTQPPPRPALLTQQPLPQTPRATTTAATSLHSPAQPIQQTVINNPIIERVVERVVLRAAPADLSAIALATEGALAKAGGITEEILNTRLGELDNKLMSKLYGISSAPGPITYGSTPPSSGGILNQIALSQRIDSLTEATITDSTFSGGTISGAAISGGSVSGASITGTIAALIDTAVATIDDLTSNTITATNVSFTNATTTNFRASATSTLTGVKLTNLDCSSLGNGGTLTTDASGNVVCAADDGGSASVGGSDTHVQFNSNGSFTGSAAFTFSSSTNLLKVPSASSTLLSIFDRLYIGGSGTTTIRADGVASTIPFASSTALTVSGTAYFSSASTTNLTVSASPSGLLTTNATGVVSASTTLGLNFGGTGATTATGARTNLAAAASGANSDITSLSGLTTALSIGQGGTGTTTGGVTNGVSFYDGSTITNSSALTWNGSLLAVINTATSTFAAGLSSTALNITGTAATSTFARGIAISAGCVSVNGTCLGTSNVTNLDSLSDTTITSAAYGDLVMYNGSAWVDTATSTLFSTSQQLAGWLSDESGTGNVAFTTSPSFTTPTLGAASATSLSLTNALTAVNGGTGTTTWQANSIPYFDGTTLTERNSSLNFNGTKLTASFASSTALSVSGTGYFATASTTNVTVSAIPSSVPYTSATGAVSGAALAASSIFVTNGSSVPSWATTLPAFTLGGAVTGGSQNVTGLGSLTAYASSTIGGGGAGTGLTIFGVGTTTSYLVVQGSSTSTFTGAIESSGYLNITGTSATSTFARGINLAGGCFSINGTCVGGSGASGANPTASVGLAAVNGVATTFMRSDAAPALSQAIAPTWTALHQFTGGASSTLLSVYNTAYFGATATSSFSSTGALTLAGITNSLLAANASGVVGPTTTPTAQYFIATSTTRASTFPFASTTALTASGTGYLGLLAATQTSGTSTIASGQGFTIGGSQFVLQQGSGNVGIGGTPAYLLDVSGTTSLRKLRIAEAGGSWFWLDNPNATTLRFSSGATPGTNPFVLNDTGNVGIGTTSPGSALSIVGSIFASSTATTTFYGGGINLVTSSGNTGCFAINSTCIGGANVADFQEFTGDGTWTKPSNFDADSLVYIEAWGGGGSGGRAGSGDGGGGGGGGAYVLKVMRLSELGATETVDVGAGAAAQTSDNTDGNVGSNTTFGAHVTAYGGAGGDGSSAIGNGGGGGGGQLGVGQVGQDFVGGNGGNPRGGGAGVGATLLGTGGTTINIHGYFNLAGGGGGGGGDNNSAAAGNGGASFQGGGGGGGGADTANAGGAGGPSTYGGGGGGGASDTGTQGAGGTSTFGGNGGAANNGTNAATAGTQPGGGGGGSEQANSGAGAAGLVRVRTIGGADIAENYPVSDPLVAPGDIVAFDASVGGFLKRATLGDATSTLAGVISTDPEIVLGAKGAAGQLPLALSGRVPVKVNLEGGEIAIGDRITISSTPGVGTKASIFDASVGIVIAPVEHGENGDTVMVFLDLQPGFDVAALTDKLLDDSGFVGFNSKTAATSTNATSTATTTPTADTSFLGRLFSSLLSRITAWLADAANGIANIISDTLTAREKLCVDDVCVTRDQFAKVFGNQNAAAGAPNKLGDRDGTPASTPAREATPNADAAATNTSSYPTPTTSGSLSTPQTAAGTADTQTHAATGGSSARGAGAVADTATTTTPSVIEPITSTASSTPDMAEPEPQPPSAAANDNQPVADDGVAPQMQASTEESSVDQPAAEETPVAETPLLPDPANDNTPLDTPSSTVVNE